MSNNKINKKELLALPVRKWDKASKYKALYIVPTRKMHDSGWMVMAIVGIKKDDSMEIAAYCDDILWYVPAINGYDFRTDCEYPSGILHFWSRSYEFEVGYSSSSVDIKLLKI